MKPPVCNYAQHAFALDRGRGHAGQLCRCRQRVLGSTLDAVWSLWLMAPGYPVRKSKPKGPKP